MYHLIIYAVLPAAYGERTEFHFYRCHSRYFLLLLFFISSTFNFSCIRLSDKVFNQNRSLERVLFFISNDRFGFIFRATEGRWHALEGNPFKEMYCFTLDNRLYGMKSYQTYEFKKE